MYVLVLFQFSVLETKIIPVSALFIPVLELELEQQFCFQNWNYKEILSRTGTNTETGIGHNYTVFINKNKKE